MAFLDKIFEIKLLESFLSVTSGGFPAIGEG
jgi:hypothetical protein